MAHLDGTPAGFADHRKGFRQNLIQRFAFCGANGVGVCDAFNSGGDAGPEFGRFGSQLFV